MTRLSKILLKIDFNFYKMKPIEWQRAVRKWAVRGRSIRALDIPVCFSETRNRLIPEHFDFPGARYVFYLFYQPPIQS